MQHIQNSQDTTNSAWLFTAGVACHSIIAAARMGLFEMLNSSGLNTIQFIKNNHATNPVVLDGVIRSLRYAKIVTKTDENYHLTPLGQEVLKDLPSYVLWFDGYSALLSKQGNIGLGTDQFSYQDIDSLIVADNSALIGKECADDYLLEVLKTLAPKNALCDLGCGNGSRMTKLCETLSVKGYGFDISKKAIQEAESYAHKHTQLKLSFMTQDVTQIEGQWPEVEILMQTFMTHHIVPDERCANVFESYKKSFPNMRYFIILDVVTSEIDDLAPQMFAPGFDYIHRLQGLNPRTHKQMIDIFNLSHYRLFKEVPLSLPNGYLWVLENPHK